MHRQWGVCPLLGELGGGGASEKEARITDLKLWELLNSEREDRITETTSVIPSLTPPGEELGFTRL